MAASSDKEIRQLAHYQVRPEGLEATLAAIRTFVDYLRAKEPTTLRYEVWQQKKDPTRFTHLFIFANKEAHEIHSRSAEVKQFASVLYPLCIAPVDFVDYDEIASNAQS